MRYPFLLYIVLAASTAMIGCRSIGRPGPGGFIAAYPHDAPAQNGQGSGSSGAPAPCNDVENAARQLEALNVLIAQAQDRLALKTNDLYEVKKGDTLCRIASRQDVYNNKSRWVRIWSVNRDIVKNPNIIYPGQMLIIHDRRAQ
jgi:resuscitation-promoting factor RpfA